MTHGAGTSRVRVLVSGANGFIGRALCPLLAADGVVVRGLVRGEPAASAVRAGIELAWADDLTDRPAIKRAMEGVDAVVHLAARVHAAADRSTDPLAEYRRTNVEGTRVLLECAMAARVRTFVLASTVKAVGEGNTVPWTEATPPAPVDPYGVSKLEAEHLVRKAARAGTLHAPVLRLPLMYGPGMKANMLRLFDHVARGTPLPLGGIENRRSLLYVGNLCAAIRTVLVPRAATNATFFLSDGRDVSTPELVRLIAAALARPARLIRVPSSVFRVAGRLGDLLGPVLPLPLTSSVVQRLLGSLSVDPSAFIRATGFHAPYSVEVGLTATAEWFRKRRTGAL